MITLTSEFISAEFGFLDKIEYFGTVCIDDATLRVYYYDREKHSELSKFRKKATKAKELEEREIDYLLLLCKGEKIINITAC